MFELWVIGAVCTFLLAFYAIVSVGSGCATSYSYPRYYDYVMGVVCGLMLCWLSWVGVVFLLMILSIPRND